MCLRGGGGGKNIASILVIGCTKISMYINLELIRRSRHTTIVRLLSIFDFGMSVALQRRRRTTTRRRDGRAARSESL